MSNYLIDNALMIQKSKYMTSETHSSSSRSPSINSLTTRLGEHVGYFDDNGVFTFLKKAEIKKVNIYYKLLADNR